MKKFSVPVFRSHSAARIHKALDGFTLLEVLVALLVFSVGLLGLASLQIFSIRLSGDSLSRTLAAIQANDLIDRMRANIVATALGINSPYNNPTGAISTNTSCLGMNGVGGYVNTSCSSTEMAQQDLYEWSTNISGSAATGWRPAVSASLPQGQGIVCIDSTPNDGSPGAPACDNQLINGKAIFAIKIWWVERKDQNNPGVRHQYITSFSL